MSNEAIKILRAAVRTGMEVITDVEISTANSYEKQYDTMREALRRTAHVEQGGEPFGYVNTLVGAFIPGGQLASTPRTESMLGTGELVRVYTHPALVAPAPEEVAQANAEYAQKEHEYYKKLDAEIAETRRELTMACATIAALKMAIKDQSTPAAGSIGEDARYNALCKELWGSNSTTRGGAIDRLTSFIDARSQPPAASVPDGWQLVPKVPTQEMIENTAAFDLEGEDDANNAYRVIYQAMLAAAPQPPAALTTTSMCERKTSAIEGEGYKKTGYVLMKDDPAARICVSDQGAVSWFTRDEWNWLMHNRDHVEFEWPKPITARIAAPQPPAAQGDIPEAITLLSAVFDAWENGIECHEEDGNYIGMAFKLDDDIFKRCCDLLNRVNPPRNARQGDDLSARDAGLEPLMANGKTTLSEYLEDAEPDDRIIDEWTKGYEECKRRLFKIVGAQLRALRTAPAQQSDAWHSAVLAECMSIEAAYDSTDPAATVKALIDWHVQLRDETHDHNKVLADNYIGLTCGAQQSDAGLSEQEIAQLRYAAKILETVKIFNPAQDINAIIARISGKGAM